jgi:hypothetical protein
LAGAGLRIDFSNDRDQHSLADVFFRRRG